MLDCQVEKIDQQKDMGKQIFIFTLLFCIIAAGVYLRFIATGTTFLWQKDGMTQQYPIYNSIRSMIDGMLKGEKVPFWSWDVGIGEDFFRLMKGYILNPFTYFISAFPAKYLDIGYTIAGVLKQYLSGVVFLCFCRKVDLQRWQSIIGALCYSFSGWVVSVTLHQGAFTNATILFPLLILGVEKVFRKESPLLFILSVFLFMSCTLSFAYIAGIFVVIYYLIRYFHYHPKGKLVEWSKRTGAFFGYGFVGIAMSGIFFIQKGASLMEVTTESAVDFEWLYPLTTYITFPSYFFTTTSLSPSYGNLLLPVLCVILLPLIVKGVRKKSTPSIMAILCLLMTLSPVFGSIFNGFSYSAGRWFFVLVFFVVWAAMECFTKETLGQKKNLVLMSIWIAGIALWNVGSGLARGLIEYNTIIGFIFGILLIFLFYVVFVRGVSSKGVQRWLTLGILLLFMGNTICTYNVTLLRTGSLTQPPNLQVGKAYEKFEKSTPGAGDEIQDDSFFRVDYVEGVRKSRLPQNPANENIYFGIRSIKTFFSTTKKSWHAYNKTMGNNAGYFDRTVVLSNDNRAGLDFLMGVKYFLGDNVENAPGASAYAPYGFSHWKTIDGVDILKNKYSMGLGITYPQYITQSELMKLPYLEREQAILQAAVVPDEYATAKIKAKHISLADLDTDVKEVPYEISNSTNIEFSKNRKLTIYKKNGKTGEFDIRLNGKVKNSMIVLSLENFTRQQSTYDESRALGGKPVKGSDGFLSGIKDYILDVSYQGSPGFTIVGTKDGMVKGAANRDGKRQGFGDVKDFNINMGYYNEISGDIKVKVRKTGQYSYDAIKVYAVPMDIYDQYAQERQQNQYDIQVFEDNYIKGSMTCDKNSIMYFSILDDPGWRIYVDGKEVEKINSVNIAFTGAGISAGQHVVELKYKTPGLIQGALLSLAGFGALLAILIYRRKRVKG